MGRVPPQQSFLHRATTKPIFGDLLKTLRCSPRIPTSANFSTPNLPRGPNTLHEHNPCPSLAPGGSVAHSDTFREILLIVRVCKQRLAPLRDAVWSMDGTEAIDCISKSGKMTGRERNSLRTRKQSTPPIVHINQNALQYQTQPISLSKIPDVLTRIPYPQATKANPPQTPTPHPSSTTISSKALNALTPSPSNLPTNLSHSAFSLSSPLPAFHKIHSSTLIFCSGLDKPASRTPLFSFPGDSSATKTLSRSTAVQGKAEWRREDGAVRFEVGVLAARGTRGSWRFEGERVESGARLRD